MAMYAKSKEARLKSVRMGLQPSPWLRLWKANRISTPGLFAKEIVLERVWGACPQLSATFDRFSARVT